MEFNSSKPAMPDDADAGSTSLYRGRKRSHLRGVLAGLVVFYPVFFLFAIAATCLHFFVVWSFSLDVVPLTQQEIGTWRHSDWYNVVPAIFLTAFVVGMAIAAWSPPRSRVVTLGWIALSLLSIPLLDVPDVGSALQLAAWMFVGPIGVASGGEFHHWRERTAV
jgi:hypothetical protein